ncbi:MAG: single-stranded-DNA-specific exonuclease RecJ [Solirubrobacteraceae bacterium]
MLESPPRAPEVLLAPSGPLPDQTPAELAGGSLIAPAPPRLVIPAYDLEAALLLQSELGVGRVLAQILVRRGYAEPAAARAFLEPTESHEPGRFGVGLDMALASIRRCIGTGERITIHGDYDVDGVCATVIMIRALRALGANVGWFLPSRQEDGYGLSAATVERLAAAGTRLLITVDCGITAVKEVALARRAGVEVVVTDHHTPRSDGVLPECPIVHPGVCGYPCPDLCGTAVAHKLADALGAPTVEEDLELVALASVADLVPLVGENRRMVQQGLRLLACTAKPGLRALMAVSSADPSELSAQVLGFRLAPRINAAGRMRRPDAGVELLLTEDRERAREIAAELDALNVERRMVERRIGWAAEALVAEQGERAAYVLAGEGWHPGIVGIVASRIVERHHRPTIVIALRGEEPAQGSGRGVPGFDLLGAVHAGAGELLSYGGHRAAAGLSVRPGRIPAFRAAFQEHAEGVLTPDMLIVRERIDAIASGFELGLGLAEELARLEPCGMGNPGSRLLVPGARFEDVRSMGEGRHARFTVTSGGARARAVAFGCNGRVAGGDGEPLDATFRLERNVWNGAVEPRLILRHALPCSPVPVEVIGEPEDYLDAVLSELGHDRVQSSDPAALAPSGGPGRGTILDRRGESVLAVLADALSAVGAVIAVCSDVPRRLPGLKARCGGFALTSWSCLERDPGMAERFRHLVALDPPTSREQSALLGIGGGFAHLAWGEAELRFALQMHELEYELRTSLVALYRSLRLRGRVSGEELEHLLRGDGPHPRSPRLAARLLTVLAELELVSLDRDLPALEIASAQPTELERSATYRACGQRYEDGRRFLSSANLRLRS